MQLAHNNRRLAPDVDTVFFMTAVEHGYVVVVARQGDRDVRRRRIAMIPPAALGGPAPRDRRG